MAITSLTAFPGSSIASRAQQTVLSGNPVQLPVELQVAVQAVEQMRCRHRLRQEGGHQVVQVQLADSLVVLVRQLAVAHLNRGCAGPG